MQQARRAIACTMLLAVSGVAGAQESYSTPVGVDYPTQVYWGDTHVHTKLSMDANSKGNKALGPDEAYRFARGQTVTAHNGQRVRLSRPLDFLVVADHAIWMGVFDALEKKNEHVLQTAWGRRLLERINKIRTDENMTPVFRASQIDNSVSLEDTSEIQRDLAFRASVWDSVIRSADANNIPGRFTAFIGFEWTPTPLYHRNVIFKDDASKAAQVLPLSRADTNDPEELWRYMQDYESATGGEVLAIPHNPNLTMGRMFRPVDFAGDPFSRQYAETRQRWEPLVEVTQIKGDSETHPYLSPEDPFADFETWNGWFGTDLELMSVAQLEKGYPPWRAQQSIDFYQNNPPKLGQKRYEYARSALQLGLDLEAELGVNPFKFGMIGSTDSHTSLSTADDANFLGKYTLSEPSEERLFAFHGFPMYGWQNSASGYAAVWAHENTRASLFAALKRKEAYATTGPRITVRFFAGWDFEASDAFRPNLAAIGYAGGVPMGGDLTNAPDDAAPRFLIRAVKDPDGANLDRVQVIKGWRTAAGELRERVYDVALSDDRPIPRSGIPQSVGSTVEIASAAYTNTIGDPELAVVWEDPGFDPDEKAFYYVRVIEIPTPRWTAYDVKFFGIPLAAIPDEVPMETQERAYTSPIWYTP